MLSDGERTWLSPPNAPPTHPAAWLPAAGDSGGADYSLVGAASSAGGEHAKAHVRAPDASDSDGFGDASVTDVECTPQCSYVADTTDCDLYEIFSPFGSIPFSGDSPGNDV